ncbi:MAG: transporter substrate-binding domain-containing protein [Desulfobacteraceae bacterium]|jgi:polar amino acid transport system substrate-binding protein
MKNKYITRWIKLIRPIRAIWAIILLIIGISAPCPAEQKPVFGSVANIVPLSYNEDGVVKGLFSDIFLDAAQRAGLEVSLKLYPVKRLDTYLRSGKIDGVVTLIRTKEREKYLTYFTSPIVISRTLVFVKKGREFPFTSVNDLMEKKIGILIGWKTENKAFEQHIKNGTIQNEQVIDQNQNLKKLMKDRIDCFIGTELLTLYRANMLGLAEHIVFLETPIAEHRVFSAISKHAKNIADPQTFIKKMDAALDEIQSDGTYDKLWKRYKVTTLK